MGIRWVRPIPRVVVLTAFALTGCETGIPKEALRINDQTFAERQMQTRRFETADEQMMLSAVAGLLQDFGFNLDESEARLGFVVGSKTRDATEAGQVVWAIFAAALGLYQPIDDKQRLRASVVTRPVGEQSQHIAVRVTFQRIVWSTDKRVTTAEAMKDPRQYQEFFDKLSKAVFLEAHEI